MSASLDREIISTRILPLAVEAVFQAWSDPKLLAKWWGPHGFTNTFREFNFAPGGVWDFVMSGPSGAHFDNKIIFTEIVPLQKVTFEHVTAPKFKVVTTFDDLGGRTKVTFRMTFEDAATRKALLHVATDGNEQNFDRLTSLLQARDEPVFNPDLDLKIERVVDLPPHLLYQGWTEPEHLKACFCPKPWIVTSAEIDLKPGGVFKTVMQSPEGESFPAEGCYLEIIENRKLVWTDATSAGYRPGKKPFMTATLWFEPHENGCKYTAIAQHATPEDRKAHQEMGFEQGWYKCLDQFVEHMKKFKT